MAIVGVNLGRGNNFLARHLADMDGENLETRLGNSRGLIGPLVFPDWNSDEFNGNSDEFNGTSDEDGGGEGGFHQTSKVDIESYFMELTDLTSHANSKQPILHAYFSPDSTTEFTDEQYNRFWQRYEREFGLQEQPFCEVEHLGKNRFGELRRHYHRAYSIVKEDGTCLRMDHHRQRNEKIARMTEVIENQELTKGAFNLSVLKALGETLKALKSKEMLTADEMVYLDEVERAHKAISKSHIIEGSRPIPRMSDRQRLQQERTGVDFEAFTKTVWDTWNETMRRNHSVERFQAELMSMNYMLVRGKKCLLVVNDKGHYETLVNLLKKPEIEKNGARIPAGEINKYFENVNLLKVDKINDFRKLLNVKHSRAGVILDKIHNFFPIDGHYDDVKRAIERVKHSQLTHKDAFELIDLFHKRKLPEIILAINRIEIDNIQKQDGNHKKHSHPKLDEFDSMLKEMENESYHYMPPDE